MRERTDFTSQVIAVLCAACILLISGCTSTSPSSYSSPAAQAPVRESSSASPEITTYFVDQAGVQQLNTRSGQRELLIPLDEYSVQKRVAPDEQKMAVSYMEGDSTKVVVIEIGSGRVQQLYAGPADKSYSFEWSPESTELAIGFFSERKSGDVYVADEGNIVIADLNGDIRNLGCGVSKKVDAWLPNGDLVVSEGRGSRSMYVVDSTDCRTLATVPIENKRQISFSPNGQYFLYYESVPVQDRSTGQTTNVPELHVARNDGSEIEKVAGYTYEPQNAAWSPDGQQIAFDVRSPEWSNIRHIAVYDLSANEATFHQKENMLGLPTSERPFWSPDGNRLLYFNSYERGDQFRVSHHIYRNVVRNLRTEEVTVLTEELVQLGQSSEVGMPTDWIDDRTVLIENADAYRIVDTATQATREMPSDRTFLYLSRVN